MFKGIISFVRGARRPVSRHAQAMTARLFLIVSVGFTACQGQSQQRDYWSEASVIEKRIVAPSFPDKDFPVTAYGAVGDGRQDCSDAIAKAITACSKAGGGRVVVPAGTYLTGPIHLQNNVNLHLAKDAIIRFSQDTRKYLPQVLTRFESIELMNYSPFVYAFEKENIALTGEGTLDGQGDEQHWWFWKKQQQANDRLKEMAEQGVPVADRVFGEGDFLRPNFIQPYRCKNVLIEGITLINSPMWVMNPVLSSNVTIRNVKVISHGPNNDGCDPESSRDVLIENCLFDTGDDCIAIKSGRDHDGRRVNTPSENIIVRGCTMKDGHGGVVIGSEVSGNVRNVFAENCQMSSPELDRALRIKSNSKRGGTIENIYMRNVQVGTVKDAVVLIDMFYMKETGDNHPTVRNIIVQHVTSSKSRYGLRLEAEEDYPATNVVITDCSFDNVEKGNLIRGIKGLTIDNVKLNGEILKP